MNTSRQKTKINSHNFVRKLRLPGIIFLLIIAISIALIGLVWQAIDDLPKLDALKNYQPPQSTVVYDRNNKVVGRFYDERRTVVPIKKMSKYVPLAFVAAEDGNFFEHHGLDYWAIVRAVILEIKYRTIGGARVGGSTITQQTARSMLLSSKQTYMRKLKEVLLARRIEHALNKQQILHLYLNQIYFGNGAYGIEEASLTYFQKPSSALELFEAAALAAIPKSPNRINPFGDTERLKARQAYVLEQMVKLDFITEPEAKKAQEALLFSASLGKSPKSIAPYFLQAVRQDLLPKIGEENINKGGLKVYSTLDINLQLLAEKSLAVGLREIDKRSGYRGPLYRPDEAKNKEIEQKLAEFKKRAFSAEGLSRVWDLRNLAKISPKKDISTLVQNSRLLLVREAMILAARVSSINQQANLAVLDLGSRTVELPFHALSWAYPAKAKSRAAPKKVSDVLKVGDIVLVKLNDIGSKIWASLEQDPEINGGFVALDIETGGVLAMVGGYDFDESSFNRVMQAKRQPGSGLKPLIYAMAIDRQIITAASIITDEPRAFYDPGTEEFWRPRNSTNKYLGDITVRHCLRSSVNTCTIQILEKTGIDSYLDLLKTLKVSRQETPFPRNLTIALGSAEVFPINFANAMRVFPNQGKYSDYYMINRVKHASGVSENIGPKTGEEQQVFKPETTFIITSILSEVISGTNRAKYLGQVLSEIAGKTGTTNKARSAWFFGYSPKILAAVYIGYDDNRSIGSSEWGVTTALPIWARFMNGVRDNQEPLRFARPSDLEWRYVNSAGQALEPSNEPGPDLADPQYGPQPEAVAPISKPETANSTKLVREVFLPGTAPATGAPDNFDAQHNRIESLDNSAFAP